MVDRYTRVVLTIIAACLVYLCLVISKTGTPLSAQANPQGKPPAGAERPGLATSPAEVVVVGWRSGADDGPLPVTVSNTVSTQPAPESVTRVVVAGWEDTRRGVVRLTADAGLPTDTSASQRPGRFVLAGTDPAPGAWRQRVPVETGKDGAPARR